MLRKFLVLLSMAAVLPCVSGCGDGSRLKGLVPVEGVVLYDGAPLEGAAIKFFPEDASGRTATAMTNAEGKFVLMTLNPQDGVAPGEYKVTVAKIASAPPTENDDTAPNEEENSRQKALRMREASRSKDSLKSLIPDKYASPARSGLTASIGAKGDKNLKFELVK